MSFQLQNPTQHHTMCHAAPYVAAHCGNGYPPRVIVAVGAAERVPLIAVTNLSRTLKQLQERGIWVSGAAGEATQTLYEADLAGPLALVMGSEGKGMRRLTREHCDFLLSIPMHGSVSSLNVSVATGVCLYEAVRQRAAKQTS